MGYCKGQVSLSGTGVRPYGSLHGRRGDNPFWELCEDVDNREGQAYRLLYKGKRF